MMRLSRKHISDSQKNYIQIIIHKDKISLRKFKKHTRFFQIKNSNLITTGIMSSMRNLRKMVNRIMERGKIIGMRNFIAEWEVKVLDTLSNQEGLKKGQKTNKISHNNLKSKQNGVKNYSSKLNLREECSLWKILSGKGLTIAWTMKRDYAELKKNKNYLRKYSPKARS